MTALSLLFRGQLLLLLLLFASDLCALQELPPFISSAARTKAEGRGLII